MSLSDLRPRASQPGLEPCKDGMERPPSIEALEMEIARARTLVDHISVELVQTRELLAATQELAQTLGRMLDDARLAAQQEDDEPHRGAKGKDRTMTTLHRDLAPAGTLGLTVIRSAGQDVPVAVEMPPAVDYMRLRDVAAHGLPQSGLPDDTNQWRLSNVRHLWRGLRRVQLARAFRLPTLFGSLWLTVIRRDGQVEPLGLASLRVVTNNGAGFIVDGFQNLVELENMKYHGIGTNNTAEAASDSALGTEITTAYNPDNTRATGTTTEASAQVFRTVGTNTVDGSAAIVEHGIFSQAATGGGVLLDRSVFSVVNLASGDSLQTTYDLTISSGG